MLYNNHDSRAPRERACYFLVADYNFKKRHLCAQSLGENDKSRVDGIKKEIRLSDMRDFCI